MKFVLLALTLASPVHAGDAWDQLQAVGTVQEVSPPGAAQGADMRRTIELLSSPAFGGRAPMSQGSELARAHIIARMRESGLAPAGADGSFLQPVLKNVFGNQIGVNVVGVVRGKSRPDECVYIDAHYDHWGMAEGKLQPGANDNASGVAMMLELAGAVAAAGPERSVVFLASDYEEGALFPMAGGLKGAAYQLEHPYCAKDKIKMALVLDAVGGPFVPGMAPRLFLIGSESSAQTRDLAAALAGPTVSPLGVYAIEPAGPSVPRANYGPFREARIPFIFATSGISPEYHTSADTADKIDYGFMAASVPPLLKIVMDAAAGGFSPVFADEPDRTANWDAELAALEDLTQGLLALSPAKGKEAYWETFKTERERWRSQISAANSERRIWLIKRSVQGAVYTLMKMNGSLKFFDHLHREHK